MNGTDGRKLDPDQEATVALRANGAVSAGAGSGKTTALAARFVDIVEKGEAGVEGILTLTFTRKAAAEMYARIYASLRASGSDRARRALGNFSESSISTIDSFCSKLVRGDAGIYGYAPDFSVDEEESKRIAQRVALSFVLERREDPVVARLLSSLGFVVAWKDLFSDASLALHSPAPSFDPDPAESVRRQRADLSRSAAARAREILDAATAALQAADGAGERGRDSRAALAAFASLPDDLGSLDPSAAARAAESLADLDLRGYRRDDADAAIKEAVKAAKKAACALALDAKTWVFMPFAEEAYRVIGECGRAVVEAKRTAGVMNYRDVALCAVDLLSTRPETREFWARCYRFIMIDEFQDDNDLQKKLLYLLAARQGVGSGIPSANELEPGKLFFVGDEKQSIYRFRGADVAVFRGLSGELGGDPPRLSTNYRSEPALVGFFNDVFARVFAGASLDYEARFEGIRPRPAGPTPGVEPTIRLLARERGDEGRNADDRALAAEVAMFIRESVESAALRIPDGSGGARAAGYGDFAVLLKSTSRQYVIESRFRRLGVPYSSAEVSGVFLESPANDIACALSTAISPGNELAYAAFLRSPFVGLSDEGFILALAREDRRRPFATEAEAALAPEDAARFANGRRVTHAIGRDADRIAIADIVLRLWMAEGLRLAVLAKPDAHPYLEHFEYLFSLAADADARGLTLAAFVAGLEESLGTPERLRDLDPPREAVDGVRIMTVHRAKGLEFPVVILPFAEGTGERERLGDAWYRSEEFGLTVNLKAADEPGGKAANVFFDRAKGEEKARRLAEVKRLFYVACTRAIAHLVVACVVPARRDSEGASFLALLAGGGGLPGPDGSYQDLHPLVGVEAVPDPPGGFSNRGGEPYVPRAEGLAAYRGVAPIERVFRSRELAATAFNAAWLAGGPAELPGETLPASAYDVFSGIFPENLFGELCHAVIQRSFGGAVDPADIVSGLETPVARALLSEAGRLADGFLSSEPGRAALAAGNAGTERGFLLDPGDGWTVSGRMDLVYEENGISYIMDFKSDRVRREGEYDLQLALYRRAMEAVAGKPARSMLFWLRAARPETRTRDFSAAEIVSWARTAAGLGAGRAVEGRDVER
ncbi:MAG: UvrD-helicase domain-containing protein [Spirochaetes bacterium]|nr:UvrD-helicase domain-containing protein [Spirochaetota bacterium]